MGVLPREGRCCGCIVSTVLKWQVLFYAFIFIVIILTGRVVKFNLRLKAIQRE